MLEQAVTAISIALLFTSVFALKFRYWTQPLVLTGYFLFFATAEWICNAYLLPPDIFGPWLGMVCFTLSVPVILVIVAVHRHEQKMNEVKG